MLRGVGFYLLTSYTYCISFEVEEVFLKLLALPLVDHVLKLLLLLKDYDTILPLQHFMLQRISVRINLYIGHSLGSLLWTG